MFDLGSIWPDVIEVQSEVPEVMTVGPIRGQN